MKYGYARVSTTKQNLDRQLKAFEGLTLDEVFTDKYSGKKVSELQELNKMIETLKPNDTVYITDIDRLGRDVLGVLTILKQFEDKKIRLHILNSPFKRVDFEDHITMFNLQIQVITADFYRKNMLATQQAGIGGAKERGVYKRPKKDKLKRQDEIIELIEKGFNKSHVAKMLGVSRQHVNNVLKKVEGA